MTKLVQCIDLVVTFAFSSPYLDHRLFSYEEKWISSMERPKACGEGPIAFHGREDGTLKFKIHPGK